jgi:hypothetical protein
MRLSTLSYRQRVCLLLAALLLFVLLVTPGPVPVPASASYMLSLAPQVGILSGGGTWRGEQDDLLYIVSFSTAQQPYGPLVVYRASGGDLHTTRPVVAIARGPLSLTPVLYPAPDGRYLALLDPLSTGYDSNINGASLSIVASDGASFSTRVLSWHVALSDPVIWSMDDSALYYMTGEGTTEEIHRVDLTGHDTLLLRQPLKQGSIRLVGQDRGGALILTLARPHLPIAILRLEAGRSAVVTSLPGNILPGNVLGMSSDGASVVYTTTGGVRFQFSLSTHRVTTVAPLYSSRGIVGAQFIAPTGDTSAWDVGAMNCAPTIPPEGCRSGLVPLARSAGGTILAMSQVVSERSDLAAQGITNVPERERLMLVDTRDGAWQSLLLPDGGQVLQAFWTAHEDSSRVQTAILPPRQRAGNGPQQNGTVVQQDLWMLEGHNNRLFDGPKLPSMCYGNCTAWNGAPHVSAAILHGIAYTESDWHQFNSSDFQVNGEPIGSPVESFDGGWGEYQQTWGMPPQCQAANNCRSDVFRVEHDQAYNIGVGIQSLINDWNSTAGVTSNTDPNDPYKANDWFFAVWAYNGSYGNNPNDVPSSQYGHWYPGAPFNSIYEERVWYFADHPQSSTTGWTDNYVPSLGPSLLPPQADFTSTDDSFVYCSTCTIPDWTAGTYDREWVGYGSPSQVAGSFTAAFAQLGGENVLGLPRDNGGGAAVHRWGSGWTQDFGGGSDQPGALMLADNTTTAYWVYASLWTQYLIADHGAPGCHGYPTSNLDPFTDPGLGSDKYLRQTFQQGYMIWDATISVIVSDVCG